MHFKPSALLAAVAFGVTASAAAVPAPDPVAAPLPDPVADPAPAHTPTWHPIDTSEWSAKIVSNTEKATCSLKLNLPNMGATDCGLDDFMDYGYPMPHACWKDGLTSEGWEQSGVCGSATVSFRGDNTIAISNPADQYATFEFTTGYIATGEHGAFTIVPGEGQNPDGNAYQ